MSAPSICSARCVGRSLFRAWVSGQPGVRKSRETQRYLDGVCVSSTWGVLSEISAVCG